MSVLFKSSSDEGHQWNILQAMGSVTKFKVGLFKWFVSSQNLLSNLMVTIFIYYCMDSTRKNAIYSKRIDEISSSHGGEWRWLSSGLRPPCSLVDVYRRFRGACYFHHQGRPDDGGNKHLWNFGKLLPDYKAQQPRRQSSTYELFQNRRVSP
jgi:hypothetical protein